ncbi:MAG: AAA family ATPase [Planctomycetaceae bacterium]|nr:AAA family ATPase [Planctomycetaceae bacterium]
MDGTRSRSRHKTESGVTPRADAFEADLLGMMLTHPQVFATLDVTKEDFFDLRHKMLFDVGAALHSQGVPVYLTTIADELSKRGELEQVGGVHTLDQMMMNAPANAANADYLAKRVCNAAIRRRAAERLDDVRGRLNAHDDLDTLPDEFAPLLQSCGHRSERLRPVSAGQLLADHAAMRPAVIDGLLRLGETANLIAAPKMGKSWLTLDLVLSVATGRRWLGAFDVVAGPVLLIDNELHPETLAKRLPTVAEARGIRPADIADKIQVIALRGRLRDLLALESDLRSITPGAFKLIVLDAFYRFLPEGTDENANAAMAQLYNRVDRSAARLRGRADPSRLERKSIGARSDRRWKRSRSTIAGGRCSHCPETSRRRRRGRAGCGRSLVAARRAGRAAVGVSCLPSRFEFGHGTTPPRKRSTRQGRSEQTNLDRVGLGRVRREVSDRQAGSQDEHHRPSSR